MRDEFTTAEMLKVLSPGDPDRRRFQFLLDNGAIKPKPATAHAGSGVHRRFHPHEAVILAVLTAFGQYRASSSIGLLISVAEVIRRKLRADEELRDNFNEAIGGRRKLFIILEPYRLIGGELTFLRYPTSADRNRLLEDMAKANSMRKSMRMVVHLTPWLARLRSIV